LRQAKTFGDLVNSVLMPMLYATIVYWSAGLKADAAAFFIFLITFGLCIQVAQSWGILVSVIFKNIGLALILAPMLTLMLMILGGAPAVWCLNISHHPQKSHERKYTPR
jgi:ABC-type transport system involved in multi-copper enzyme maturation permease subunit